MVMADPSRMAPVFRKCLALVHKMMSARVSRGGIFNRPVNYNQPFMPLYTPKYLNLVPHLPMDLSTVANSLKANVYTTTDAFATDMRHIWENALAFHPDPSHPAHLAAQDCRGMFEKEFHAIVEPLPAHAKVRKVLQEIQQPRADFVPAVKGKATVASKAVAPRSKVLYVPSDAPIHERKRLKPKSVQAPSFVPAKAHGPLPMDESNKENETNVAVAKNEKSSISGVDSAEASRTSGSR